MGGRSLVLARQCRLFVLKRNSSGLTGHTAHCTFLSCSCFLVVPAAVVYSPVLAVHPSFLAFCRGAILGRVRFVFFGFSRYLLRSFLPSRTRGGMGVCGRFFLLFLFSSFCVVRSCFTQTRRFVPPSNVPDPGSTQPAPCPSEGPGVASHAGAVNAP